MPQENFPQRHPAFFLEVVWASIVAATMRRGCVCMLVYAAVVHVMVDFKVSASVTYGQLWPYIAGRRFYESSVTSKLSRAGGCRILFKFAFLTSYFKGAHNV